jgi:hypothetical protein
VKFYLGTHRPNWLGLYDVPLFVSHRTLSPRATFPRARGSWALDSGGFSELSLNGRWVTTEDAYVEAVQRYSEEIGRLDWAAPMDWMCEPHMLELTGLSVREHQERTVQNYLNLRDRGPFIPVLQGWQLDDYLQCVELYESAGVDLRMQPTVGVGSVCRRQHTSEIDEIMRTLHGLGLRMHGFGVKVAGLRRYGQHLRSADSMAWSFRARRSAPLPGCTHKNCANCPLFAMQWRDQILSTLNPEHHDPMSSQIRRAA